MGRMMFTVHPITVHPFCSNTQLKHIVSYWGLIIIEDEQQPTYTVMTKKKGKTCFILTVTLLGMVTNKYRSETKSSTYCYAYIFLLMHIFFKHICKSAYAFVM